MTLKFKMKSEEGARETKEALIEQASMLDYITLADVKARCGQPVEMNYVDDQNDQYGWKWSDLKGQNIVVRKVRKTWYLYLVDPPLKVSRLTKNPPVENTEKSSEGMSPIEFIDYMVSKLVELEEKAEQEDPHCHHRKCVVIFKKGDNTIKKPAWFHEYEQQCLPSRSLDGMISQKLAIVEYMDGTTDEVKPKSIKWEEWN